MNPMTFFLSLAIFFAPLQQGGVILVPSEHHSVPTLFEYDTVLWLENNRPADTNLYAVMDYSFNRNGEFISLAGLAPDLPAPYDDWSIFENHNVIWTGTLVRKDGIVTEFLPYGASGNAPKFASITQAGGSTAIYFPWQAGKKMMFGERGVHGGGFGVSGAVGIDWVGGDQFPESANNTVYASASGTVTQVCEDGTSMALLVAGTETIGYFHLEPNTDIETGDTITRGQPLGYLIYGSFPEDDCGWASQQSYNYHLHWVIVPSGGYYRSEGWVLNTGAVAWERGNEKVKTKQWLNGGGGSGTPPGDDDGTMPPVIIIDPGDPGNSGGGGGKLFDYVVLGINEIYGFFKSYYVVDEAVVTAQEDSFVMANNMMRTMIQDWNLLLVNDVIALQPWYMLAMTIFIAEFVRWAIIIVLTVLIFLDRLPGIA